jgi:tetratricopeptide (TPR) repeat protein
LDRLSFAEATLESARKSVVAGDLACAERLCRSVIAASPHLAAPWIVLGDVELARNRPDLAIGWAEKAISHDPKNPLCHILLSRSQLGCGKFTEAAAAAEAACGVDDCPPSILDRIGMLFVDLSRHERALEMFRRAVAAEPHNPVFLYNLAVAERVFGALEQAENHCDQALALNPRFYDAYFIRADLRKQTVERNHVAEMEALLARGVREPEGEVLLRYALGKECEDLGHYGLAFVHFDAGARLKRRNIRYDVNRNLGVMERIGRAHSRDTLDRIAARGGAAQEAPIFIVGLPRSGTSLIERIVTGHSRTVAAGELSAFPTELTRAAKLSGVTRGGDWVESLESIDLTRMGHAYARIARESGLPADRRFTDKFPSNFLYCGAIRVALPNARIIALRRGGMDSCFALYKQLFAKSVHPYSYDLDELAQYYAAFSKLISHWRNALSPDFFLEVSYEDIVADLEGESRRILAFLGLPWEDGVLRFHESAAPATTASAVQVRQPIYASSVGKWRNYATELEPLRARLAELMPGEDLG